MRLVRTFSRNLQTLRAWRKLTLAELAARSGLSLAHLRELEADLMAPQLSTIAILAESLGVAPVQLLFARATAAPARVESCSRTRH